MQSGETYSDHGTWLNILFVIEVNEVYVKQHILSIHQTKNELYT